jgi:hypothetical protein
MSDTFQSLFGGGQSAAATAPPDFSAGNVGNIPAVAAETNPGDWSAYIPPGSTVSTPAGGVAPGAVGSLPGPGGSAGGGFSIGKMIPAAVGGIGGIVNMFRKDPTDAALKKLEKSTGPMQAAGNQALGAYTSGNLTPTQQAKVDQFKQQNLAKWRQYLASAGIPESSAMADIEAKVNQDAQVYADSLLQQDFTNAYAATGLTTTNLTNVARQQALQDAEQRKQWEDFMKELGAIGGDVADMFAG